jgi:hypothetical protein
MTPALSAFVDALRAKLAAEDRLRRTPRGTPARDRAELIVEAAAAACLRARSRLSPEDEARVTAAVNGLGEASP